MKTARKKTTRLDDVDILIDSRSLTSADEMAISVYIRKDKERRASASKKRPAGRTGKKRKQAA